MALAALGAHLLPKFFPCTPCLASFADLCFDVNNIKTAKDWDYYAFTLMAHDDFDGLVFCAGYDFSPANRCVLQLPLGRVHSVKAAPRGLLAVSVARLSMTDSRTFTVPASKFWCVRYSSSCMLRRNPFFGLATALCSILVPGFITHGSAYPRDELAVDASFPLPDSAELVPLDIRHHFAGIGPLATSDVEAFANQVNWLVDSVFSTTAAIKESQVNALDQHILYTPRMIQLSPHMDRQLLSQAPCPTGVISSTGRAHAYLQDRHYMRRDGDDCGSSVYEVPTKNCSEPAGKLGALARLQAMHRRLGQ